MRQKYKSRTFLTLRRKLRHITDRKPHTMRGCSNHFEKKLVGEVEQFNGEFMPNENERKSELFLFLLLSLDDSKCRNRKY